MKRIVPVFLFACGLMASVIIGPQPARSQEEATLDARQRLFPDVGPGFRVVRRAPDGTYYVLTLRSLESKRARSAARVPLVLVCDRNGRKLQEIAEPRDEQPNKQKGRTPEHAGREKRPQQRVETATPFDPASAQAAALDVDTSGRIYLADTARNSVSIFSSGGALLLHLAIPAPTQIVALPGGLFAISSANGNHLITVYDINGKPQREFGELADVVDDAALNRRLNAGYLASDRAGNLYFAFRYFPEPTVRKYNSATGYLLDELTLNTLDLEPMAQSARQELARGDSGAAIIPHEIISALGLDPETQEFWLALGNLLLHFNNADHMLSSSRVYTKDGARMLPNFILPEKGRLTMGGDPLGIWDFPAHSAASKFF